MNDAKKCCCCGTAQFVEDLVKSDAGEAFCLDCWDLDNDKPAHSPTCVIRVAAAQASAPPTKNRKKVGK